MTLKQLEKRVQARLEEINGGESSPLGYDQLIEAAYLENIPELMRDWFERIDLDQETPDEN